MAGCSGDDISAGPPSCDSLRQRRDGDCARRRMATVVTAVGGGAAAVAAGLVLTAVDGLAAAGCGGGHIAAVGGGGGDAWRRKARPFRHPPTPTDAAAAGSQAMA
ncbi:hypothetical protein I4F81_012751 [Pyropia yezoensis]|uniref:Uncharacterized protein n=1 Tax=Pyropia yezoensis TaxID=2788 RepID=A0ACC3CJ19_PYRYE|nr:hypothetical protein I4F81_012751 [Neopyropia yezoensis]